jgi:predicted AAA+ superfamily ATPase
MSGTTTKPWPQLVHLRQEVRDGSLSMEEFAANLYDVSARTGQRPLYEDPARFFSLTYATPALRKIAEEVADRLRGKSARASARLNFPSAAARRTHWSR